ncbi:MAG: trimethylamine methyltransferase family protein, partial [Deltaproteobacteria bacterium]
GIEVNDETLAFDVLREVGPGGHFVSNRHTRRHMRSEQFQPQLSDRQHRDRWRMQSAKDARARAADKAREVLDGATQPVLAQGIREKIKSEIPGLRPVVLGF